MRLPAAFVRAPAKPFEIKLVDPTLASFRRMAFSENRMASTACCITPLYPKKSTRRPRGFHVSVERTLLKKGCVVTLDSGIRNPRQAAALIEDAKTAGVGPNLSAADAQVIDAS